MTAKATRLLVEGRVAPHPEPAHVFSVEGDTGSYTTIVGPTVALCTCRAHGRCYHIDAAAARVAASPREIELMDRAVAERRADRAWQAEQAFARLERSC